MFQRGLLILILGLALGVASAHQESLHPLLPPKNAPFGHGLLPYFMFDQGLRNFNHGSLGATPRYVVQSERNFSAQVEANPGANQE